MTTHRGTTVLLLDGGRELAAAANLSKDSTGSWFGTLTFPASVRTPELLNLRHGQLRVDGREGKFDRQDTADWLDSPNGQFRIKILGNGDAPF